MLFACFGGNGRAFGIEGRGWGAFDFETARGVVEIEEDAAAGFGDHSHGLVEDFAAVAVGGEDVACSAAGVDADEDGVRVGWARRGCVAVRDELGNGTGACGGAVGAKVAADEGDVAFAAVDFAFVGDHAELAVAGLDSGLAGADDVALVAEAVADELGDGEDLEAVLAAEGNEVGDAGHLAVVAHDFADDAGGGEAGHPSEIDGGLGLSGADQNAAAARAQREDVAGTGEVGRGGAEIDGGADGAGAVRSGNASRHAFAGFDGLSKCGAEARGVLPRHGKEAQGVGALLGEGEADEAAAVAGHEVDGLGGDVLGGQGEVALVLAVLVVDYDDHAARANFVECAGDVGEGRLGSAGGLGHDAALFSLMRAGNARKGRCVMRELTSEFAGYAELAVQRLRHAT